MPPLPPSNKPKKQKQRVIVTYDHWVNSDQTREAHALGELIATVEEGGKTFYFVRTDDYNHIIKAEKIVRL